VLYKQFSSRPLQLTISSRDAHRSPLPPDFIEPCLPTPAEQCKSGPAWVHEIKHDGYRMIARRTSDRVRLYTRRGFNWADRYPRIVEALRSLRVRSIVIDGEAVTAARTASQISIDCILARMTRASSSMPST
jgi:ATP-dependent DNA ligase